MLVFRGRFRALPGALPGASGGASGGSRPIGPVLVGNALLLAQFVSPKLRVWLEDMAGGAKAWQAYDQKWLIKILFAGVPIMRTLYTLPPPINVLQVDEISTVEKRCPLAALFGIFLVFFCVLWTGQGCRAAASTRLGRVRVSDIFNRR